MRLSVDSDDAGHMLFGLLRAAGRTPTIYLDGLKQDHVIMADDERGEVLRFKTDDAGHVMRDGDDAARELLTGKVTIQLDPQ
jgi:hypothetical protein